MTFVRAGLLDGVKICMAVKYQLVHPPETFLDRANPRIIVNKPLELAQKRELIAR